MAFDIYNPEEDEFIGDDACPNCNTIYDEIDYEYQICSWCKFDNSVSTIKEIKL